MPERQRKPFESSFLALVEPKEIWQLNWFALVFVMESLTV